MPAIAWYGPLFYLGSGGGLLLALRYDDLGDWNVTEDDYDDLAEEVEGNFLLRPAGRGHALVLGEDDGLNEAHWMRLAGQVGVTLVAWSEWADPMSSGLPQDLKQLARRWDRGEDPRQPWLVEQMSRGDLAWERLGPPQDLDSGVLCLSYAEGRPSRSRLARPRAVADAGQIIPVGVAPGRYQIETAVVDELPEGEHYVLLARWVPV
jgi:hypothetical protein